MFLYAYVVKHFLTSLRIFIYSSLLLNLYSADERSATQPRCHKEQKSVSKN